MIRIYFLLLYFPALVSAQNLVVNGGFERLKTVLYSPIEPCQFNGFSSGFTENILNWNTVMDMTPDIFTVDSASAPCRFMPRPHSGKRMIAMVWYHPQLDNAFGYDYHEFIQGVLNKPMEPGKTYRIRFWLNSNDSIGVQHIRSIFSFGGIHWEAKAVYSNNFGIYFTEQKFKIDREFTSTFAKLKIRPQVNITKVQEIRDQWTEVTATFVADKPYKYLTFGNFFPDAATATSETDREAMDQNNASTTRGFWQKPKRIAYYFIDDFSITTDIPPPPPPSLEEALTVQKKYTFSAGVLFDAGKSQLRPEARMELDQLVEFMLKHPAVRLEISGHTDSDGTEEDNQLLSEQRAAAVCAYLSGQKIPPAQFLSRGFGETQPVAGNDTPPGKQQNRRVECKVID